MRSLIIALFVVLVSIVPASAAEYVRGHTRGNGTYVQPYYRSHRSYYYQPYSPYQYPQYPIYNYGIPFDVNPYYNPYVNGFGNFGYGY